MSVMSVIFYLHIFLAPACTRACVHAFLLGTEKCLSMGRI
jgi:hypothetical protein